MIPCLLYHCFELLVWAYRRWSLVGWHSLHDTPNPLDDGVCGLLADGLPKMYDPVPDSHPFQQMLTFGGSY